MERPRQMADLQPSRYQRFRYPLMGLAILALLVAMWVGLGRLGWTFALRPVPLITHGPLMISAFLGTLIGVERAVALGRRWAYAGPLFTALGGLALVLHFPGPAGPLLMTVGSLHLVIVFTLIVREHPALYTVSMGVAALAWLVGNMLWLSGRAIPTVVLWWVAFLVLTIAGERLELSRLLRPPSRIQTLFLLAGGLFLTGLIVSVPAFDAGVRLSGAGIIALTVWLLRYDIARQTVRREGLTRFIAVCLLTGYAWAGVGGLIALVVGGVSAGPLYDAMLHAILVGFVFSMIFGHAPIIFPAILNRPITYSPRFYAHLVLLHLSLILRVASDLGGWVVGRKWGGLINAIALLLFLGSTAYALVQKGTTGDQKPPESRENDFSSTTFSGD